MGTISMLKSAGKYPTYVLFILMLVYLVNQMDRYVLAVSSEQMACDVHFGKRICKLSDCTKEETCTNATDQIRYALYMYILDESYMMNRCRCI